MCVCVEAQHSSSLCIQNFEQSVSLKKKENIDMIEVYLQDFIIIIFFHVSDPLKVPRTTRTVNVIFLLISGQQYGPECAKCCRQLLYYFCSQDR